MSMNVPEAMAAIAISQLGGPEVLKPPQMPVPVPDEGELLVRVHAAGVNRPDVGQRQGVYPPPTGATETAKVLEVTDGHGADAILDMVGGDYLDRNVAAAAIEGRISQIAFVQGDSPKVTLFPLVRKRVSLTGSLLRPRSIADKAAMGKAIEAQIWPKVANGSIRP